jgi:hypothetical protein
MEDGIRVWLSQLIADLAKMLSCSAAFRSWASRDRELKAGRMTAMIKAGINLMGNMDFILDRVDRNSKV